MPIKCMIGTQNIPGHSNQVHMFEIAPDFKNSRIKIYFFKLVDPINRWTILCAKYISFGQSIPMIIVNDKKSSSWFTHSSNFGKFLHKNTRNIFRKFYSAEIQGRILILITVDKQVCYSHLQTSVLACYLHVIEMYLLQPKYHISVSFLMFEYSLTSVSTVSLLKLIHDCYWSWVYQCSYVSCLRRKEGKRNIRIWKVNIPQFPRELHSCTKHTCMCDSLCYHHLQASIRWNKHYILAEFAIRRHELLYIHSVALGTSKK